MVEHVGHRMLEWTEKSPSVYFVWTIRYGYFASRASESANSASGPLVNYLLSLSSTIGQSYTIKATTFTQHKNHKVGFFWRNLCEVYLFRTQSHDYGCSFEFLPIPRFWVCLLPQKETTQ